MGAKRVIWHLGFERNLRRRGSPSFEIRAEVPLSEEPARVDYLLLRKVASRGLADEGAQTLRRLWPLLPRVTIVEYKSPSRPYRSGDLDRLWSYVHAYFADQRAIPRVRADGTPNADAPPDVTERAELCAVLVVSKRGPSLNGDVVSMGLDGEDLGDGYHRVRGGIFTLYVIEIDLVGPAEGDDLLYSLGHGAPLSPEVRWFWMELLGSKDSTMSMQDMEGYKDLMDRLLDTLPPEQVLSHYQPEQRLAGLPAEQRLAGLDRDHQALALPVELLRLLPDEYFRSLSPEVEAEVRRRLEKNGH